MVVSAGVATVPTVDLAPFMADSGITVGMAPTAAQIKVAAQIDRACRLHGFVHVVNFGLSSDLERAAFAESSSLFALSDNHKRDMLVRITPQTNTGYSPYMHESLNRSRPADLKEAFNVRNPELHPNNFIGCTDTFKTTTLELWTTIAKATRRYAMACALALGVEPDFFITSMKEMDLCTLRFLHYPPLEVPNSKSTDTIEATLSLHESF
jgi:isopenicillin N synthase-like dioxygenase